MVGIDPLYFLDEMSQDEVASVLKARNKDKEASTRVEWEQTRLMCYFSATAFGGGSVKKPADLFSLPWDGEAAGEQKPQKRKRPLTREEFKKKAEAVGRKLNKVKSDGK